MEVDYKKFIETDKSIIIAPAGYGKTHIISESLKYTNGRQLILTHTHAGISSIKTKLKKSGVSSNSYNVETITSFAQKFVLSFYTGTDIPEQEDSKNYYPFLIEKATYLFSLEPIKKIIKLSYNGFFVDEYQDCTHSQHNFILSLSKILPTHILGDYLQGIFNFNPEYDQIVDLSDSSFLEDFYKNYQELDTPWRWIIGGNEELGLELKDIRKKIISGEPINLSIYNNIDFYKARDIYSQPYYSKIFDIIDTNNSLLIINPISARPEPRIRFIQAFKNSCVLLEAIDCEDFYNLAKELDNFNSNTIYEDFSKFGLEIFNKGEFRKWFNNSSYKLVKKTLEQDKNISNKIKLFLDFLENKLSYKVISELLIFISKIKNIKIYRKDLFFSLIKSLRVADTQNISVYESMINTRNLIRRIGNRIEGKCVGTTLLTKGLEFDTVVILNAHEFKCPKNLYVALTRASKKLIIFSNNNILNPYAES